MTIVYILFCLFIVNYTNAYYACNHFESYLKNPETTDDCFYNEDIHSNMPTLLKKYFGNYENHTVTTEDGYILHLFRIPQRKPKAVVILQHPLVTDSIIWISQGRESLSYLLWMQGYEIWLPNNRGTYFSTKHTNFKSTDTNYWNFSFHEIGLMDFSSIMTYISNITHRNDLIMIAHSMSTTASYVYASLKPKEAEKLVKVFILLGPGAYMKHTRWFFHVMYPNEALIMKLLQSIHSGPVLEYDSMEGKALRVFMDFPYKQLIVTICCSIFGWTPEEFDPRLYNIMLSLNPRGFSYKILAHYMQLIGIDNFVQYDHGIEENMKYYNSTTPPEYPLSNIKVPLYMIISKDDTLMSPNDAEIMYQKLPKQAKIYGRKIISGINHIDFQYGKSRVEKVYKPIFKLLHKIT